MVSFDFKAEFVPLIESGHKIQTIRGMQRATPGQAMHLYTGLRTKHCRLIKVETCLSSRPVIITPEGPEVMNGARFLRLNAMAAQRFARADGFPHYDAMYDWFNEMYGAEVFTGFVHRWGKI